MLNKKNAPLVLTQMHTIELQHMLIQVVLSKLEMLETSIWDKNTKKAANPLSKRHWVESPGCYLPKK